MLYDKGPQLTVGMLKRYLSYIPDDVKIRVEMGEMNEEAHYLHNDGGELTILCDSYMEDAPITNKMTVISFMMQEN